jgi:hypothetical protein
MATNSSKPKVPPGQPLSLAAIRALGKVSHADIVRATGKWRRDARGLKQLLPLPAPGARPPSNG